jgi:hypothetical protein
LGARQTVSARAQHPLRTWNDHERIRAVWRICGNSAHRSR